MDDEVEVQFIEVHPLKHSKWTLVVLGASWLTGVARETTELLQNVSLAAAQHNLHKREESKFYEVVEKYDG